MLLLRPHHLHCLFFFSGKGYSPAFIQNMQALQAKLRTGEEDAVRWRLGEDALCECCPQRTPEGPCLSEARVLRFDRAAVELYRLQLEKTYRFDDIQKHIYSEFTACRFSVVCQDCEWKTQGVCSESKIEIQKQFWCSGK